MSEPYSIYGRSKRLKNFKFKKIIAQAQLFVKILFLLISLFFFFLSSAYSIDENQYQNEEGQNQSELLKTANNNEPNAIERGPVFQKSYNAVYQFINDNQYLLAPISGALAAGTICGSWCFVGGGLTGVIDELSIYYGFADKHYLSWGIFGLATSRAIKTTPMSNIAGIAVGILLPNGILMENQEFIAPLVGAIAGNSIVEIFGMMAGGMAGAIDEAGIYGGSDRQHGLAAGMTYETNLDWRPHYLTFETLGVAIAKLFGYSNPISMGFVGTILGALAINHEQAIKESFSAPIKVAGELYSTYGKFIPKKELNSHLEKQAISLIGSRFLTQLLSLKVIQYNQVLTYYFERLDNPEVQAFRNIKSNIVNFAIFLFPYVIGQTISSSIDDYFGKKLYFTLEDKIRNGLFSGESALRLSHDRNSTLLIDNFKDDVSNIVHSGTGLISGVVSTSIHGAYGIGIIIVSSPDTFIYYTLYNKACNFVSELLAKQHKNYSERITTLVSQLNTLMKHEAENIRTITERDGISFTKEKTEQLSTDLREQEGIQRLWGIVRRVWYSISEISDYVFNYYLVSNAIDQKRIAFDDRNKIQTANWQVSNLLSWSGQNAESIVSIRQSLDRVVVLEGKIHATERSEDQINRIFKGENQLILQDLEIGVAGSMLTTVKDLRLDMGKAYAITGETGCGKTSLLSKIKGLKENGIAGKGTIYYPKINGRNPKIVMLSQQDYFPIDSTLQEVISYPEKISKDAELNNQKREEMRMLLKEIGLHSFVPVSSDDNNAINKAEGDEVQKSISKGKKKGETEAINLDSKKDWYTVLSGGEKKKILIVSTIIKKPDILILDEIFNGLDINSIITVQKMLKKYLPNTLMLIVDHHARDNNYNSFYTKELNFHDKAIVVSEIISRIQ